MATMQQQQNELNFNLNALKNSDYRDEVIIAAKASLLNCLSETNLHLSIPALKSKTRGKVHTPDSSRYWLAHSYESRFQNGHEPKNIDKFLRLWFKDHCNSYKDEVLPDAPHYRISLAIHLLVRDNNKIKISEI